MKEIQTLIPDIYSCINAGKIELSPEFGVKLQERIQENFVRQSDRLRMSSLGPKCPKALWHSINTPELAEKLPPWAVIKYAYGHILEILVIELAKAAGHSVTGEQDYVEVDGVTGHRDCVIDGCVVDVKSASSRMFQKFKDKTLGQDDQFGYLDQLDGYLVGSNLDPLVQVKDRGYILAIDKQLGHLTLYEHHLREDHIRSRIRSYKGIVAREHSPSCTCGLKEIGKSGNIGLDVKAAYSPYKHCCFPHLRTFLYATGPVYLTHVERLPDVPEILSQNVRQVHIKSGQ